MANTRPPQEPLARVKGLGSAQKGSGHWLAQRVSSVALAGLSIWFLLNLKWIVQAPYELLIQWVAKPFTATLLSLWILSLFYHAYLGLKVVIEDYVHQAAVHYIFLYSLKFLSIFLSALSLFYILRISLVGFIP